MFKKIWNKVNNLSIYLVSACVVKGIHYLATPIFTRIITKEEYGIVSMFVTWTNIFSIFIALQVSSTIPSAFIKFEGKLKEYISSVLKLSLLSMVFVSGIVTLFNDFFTRILQLENNWLIPLLLISAYGKAMLNVLSAYTIQIKKAKVNAIISIGVSFLLLAFGCAGALIISDCGFVGKAAGEVIIYFLVICGTWVYFSIASKNINKTYWKTEIILGIPLIIHLLSTNIITQSDRIFITSMMGHEYHAVYNVAYSIGMLIVIVVEALFNVWTPWFFGRLKASRSDTAAIRKMHGLSVVAISILSGFIIIFCPIIYKVMAPESYIGGLSSSIIIVISALFNFYYRFPLSYEQFVGNLKWVALATGVASVCNLVLNYFFINAWGIEGAAIATAISTFVLWIIHEIVVRKVIKDYPIGYSVNLLGIVIVMTVALICMLIDGIVVKIILGIALLAFSAIVLLKMYRKVIKK